MPIPKTIELYTLGESWCVNYISIKLFFKNLYQSESWWTFWRCWSVELPEYYFFLHFFTFTIFPHRRQFLENIFKKCGWRKGVMGEAGSGGWQPEGELPLTCQVGMQVESQ